MITSQSVYAKGEEKVYYKTAQKNYSDGDIDDAIFNLECAIEINRKYKKAQKLLVKILKEAGTKYYNEKNYVKAHPYLEKAHGLSPDDKEIKALFEVADKEVRLQKEKERKKKEEEKRKQLKLEAKRKTEEERRRREKVEREKREAGQRRERVKAGREKKELEAKIEIEKKEKWTEIAARLRIEKKQRRITQMKRRIFTVFSFIGYFIIIGGVVYILFYIQKWVLAKKERALLLEREMISKLLQDQARAFSDKVMNFQKTIEGILLNQQERVLRLLERQSEALRGEVKKMVVKKPDGGYQIITDVNPHIRARADGVEVIEATVEDPATGERLLEPFLKDKDSRVKANAAKGLYKFNKEKAMVILGEMCRSEDQWMRLSASWVLGEIGTTTALEILLVLLKDPNEQDFVKERVIKSLKKVLTAKRKELPTKLITEIEDALKDIEG
ncbi:HEAT repeat domain-containing protein [bacterium]|nr:HEAT repeat domain-containing protein [bacterium]